MTRVPASLGSRLSAAVARQGGFAYSRDGWRSWTGGLEGNGAMLDALPPTLDRPTAARIVEDQLATSPQGIVPAFTAAMMWGHGTSGYGPYRTARVLTGERSPWGLPVSADVVARLSESVEIARANGAVAGYRYMNNANGRHGGGSRLIAGLGPAFFTKWLYFVTARGDASSTVAAPVLDALVIRWLTDHADLRLRAGYTDDYARYVETLTAWGLPYGLGPATVEEQIFELARRPQA